MKWTYRQRFFLLGGRILARGAGRRQGRALLAVACLVFMSGLRGRGDEPVSLPELSVTGRSGPTQRAPSLSASSMLEDQPDLIVLPQGNGSQRDLRLRGSSFSEAGFMVGGLSLKNPQTEHFQADLPLAAGLFAPAEVLTGMDQILAGSGHLVGSIGMDFTPVTRSGALRLGMAEAGGFDQSLLIRDRLSPTWGASAFGWRAQAPGTDYGHNELQATGGGLHLQRREDTTQFDAVAAGQVREFGAQGFYGVSPGFDAAERTEDMLFLASLEHTTDKEGDVIRATASTRLFRDDYLLSERSPSMYRNRHRTITSAVMTDGFCHLPSPVGLRWRLLAEDERIDSSGIYSGASTAGLGQHDRQRLGATLLPEVDLGDLTLHAGGQVLMLRGSEALLLALGGAEWRLTPGQTLALSYTETARQPSFTELDYASPTSLGNRGLDNEMSHELGLSLASAWSAEVHTRIVVYRRETDNTTDWIRAAPGARWLATDVGTVVTTGAEMEVTWTPNERVTGSLTYAALSKQGDMDMYASRYVFDYPQHQVVAAAKWTVVPWCDVRSRQTVTRFIDNPARNSDRDGLDIAVWADLHPSSLRGTVVSLGVSNLLEDDLELYPGQRAAGRQVSATWTTTW